MSEMLNSQEHAVVTANAGLSQKLLDELLAPTLDLSTDYAEIYLDDLIQNETLQNIPIIKSVVGVIKGGISINQFWFAKKLLKFIQQFNSGNISPEKLADFRRKLQTEKNLGKKIAEKLMIVIDRNIEIKETQIVANLFKAYVDQKLSFEEFNRIVITLGNLNPKSYKAFFDLENFDFTISESNHQEIGPRNFEMEALITHSGFALETASWFHGFELTEDGKKLFEYGIKPLGS